MQDNHTTPPDHNQPRPTSGEGRSTIDQSVVKMRRGTARNGNGDRGHAQDPPALSPWPLKTLAELEDDPPEDKRWLVEELLPAYGLSILAGLPKSGKSTVARYLAVEVARGGGKWLGREVRQGTVLDLSLEDPVQTLCNHYRHLDAPGRHIYLLTTTHPAPEDVILWLQSAITRYMPSLVIIDTINLFLTFRNTNDCALTPRALDPLINLAREFNTHILLIQHTRKGSGRYGSDIPGLTGLAVNVDTIITLDVNDDQRVFLCVCPG